MGNGEVPLETIDDPESTEPPEQQPTSEICNNGVDDDGDGKTDSDDSECGELKGLKADGSPCTGWDFFEWLTDPDLCGQY